MTHYPDPLADAARYDRQLAALLLADEPDEGLRTHVVADELAVAMAPGSPYMGELADTTTAALVAFGDGCRIHGINRCTICSPRPWGFDDRTALERQADREAADRAVIAPAAQARADAVKLPPMRPEYLAAAAKSLGITTDEYRAQVAERKARAVAIAERLNAEAAAVAPYQCHVPGIVKGSPIAVQLADGTLMTGEATGPPVDLGGGSVEVTLEQFPDAPQFAVDPVSRGLAALAAVNELAAVMAPEPAPLQFPPWHQVLPDGSVAVRLADGSMFIASAEAFAAFPERSATDLTPYPVELVRGPGLSLTPETIAELVTETAMPVAPAEVATNERTAAAIDAARATLAEQQRATPAEGLPHPEQEPWEPLTFFAPGVPKPQGSKDYKGHVNGKAVLVEATPEVYPWRVEVKSYAQKAMGERAMLQRTVAVTVNLDFVMPRPAGAPKRTTPYAVKRPDQDKLTRAVWDAITGVVLEDDSQVVASRERTRLAEPGEATGVYVTVTNVVERWL